MTQFVIGQVRQACGNFDDIVGADMCDYTGERMAMTDFNSGSQNAKISPEYYARLQHFHQTWNYHNFAHPDYCRLVGCPQSAAKPDGALRD
jgi:hypothetical protein